MVELTGYLKQLDEIISSDDLLQKPFEMCGRQAAIAYLDGLSDKVELEQNVLKRLVSLEGLADISAKTLSDSLSYSEQLKTETDVAKAADAIAEGDVILLIDGAEEMFVISLRKYDKRAIVEPPSSGVLRGPREGFIEDAKVNITLIRRRLKTPSFKLKQFTVGKYSNTLVAVAYLDGIADDKVIDRVKRKLEQIDIDGIIDSSYVATFLSERKFSIFDQIGSSEKPDIIAAKLLEGRVAIIVDGSPFVLTVPFLLFEHFQDSYDYYTGDIRATALRLFRLVGAFFTVLLPALYVAMQTFHYHLLPLKFLITIQNSISGIPFTPPLEMLVVLILFEVLHQASIRMPKGVGITLSIVGAIVLGETGVNAGLIGSPAVLIIALSAIGANCIPEEIGALSILRLMFLLIASVAGMFGLLIAIVALIIYFVSGNSYGTPYCAPYSPLIASDLKDGVIKTNLINMKSRPYSMPNKNRTRLSIKNEEENK